MIPEKVMSINNLLCIYVARASGTPRYRSFHNAERDLSCLLLADLSLSTDAYVSNEQRIIDVVRDSHSCFPRHCRRPVTALPCMVFHRAGATTCASTPLSHSMNPVTMR